MHIARNNNNNDDNKKNPTLDKCCEEQIVEDGEIVLYKDEHKIIMSILCPSKSFGFSKAIF